MRPAVYFLRLALVAILTISFAVPALAEEKPPEPLRFGALPVIQCLPMFVAAEMGLYKAEGLEVELVPFRTAMDKEVAMTAGQIDGYFGDLFTPILLRGSGVDLRIVARNFVTGGGQRMFAVLAGKESGLTSIGDLAGTPVAASSGTIIEYVTRSLLEQGGVPAGQVELLETKNIPLRYQMLVSGQAQAATLPEPLVTLAEKEGARVLADDSRSELTSTVIVFSKAFIENRPQDLTRFLTAVGHAVEVINDGNHGVREIMNQQCRVPKPLQDTYPVPKFPKLGAPDRGRVEATVKWLADRGALKSQLTYDQIVDGSYIR